ncbi:MAG: hypothetical protein IJV97_00585 [Alphaproteobacteria bacterium]|nr:hypothetical protein [Alphaproteobacteria bacterium]
MSEILFEYIRQGVYVKVTAIEPDTKTEVSVVVPANLSQEQMNLQALQKLNYVLRKKSED